MVHDNLPKVSNDIKNWKLGLASSSRYLEGTDQAEEQDEDEDDQVGEPLDNSQEEIDVASESLLEEEFF